MDDLIRGSADDGLIYIKRRNCEHYLDYLDGELFATRTYFWEASDNDTVESLTRQLAEAEESDDEDAANAIYERLEEVRHFTFERYDTGFEREISG